MQGCEGASTRARFQRLSKGGDRVALADFQALPELAGNALVPRVLALADRDRDGYLRLQDFTDAVGELGRLHTDSARAACARPNALKIKNFWKPIARHTLSAACKRPHASVPGLWSIAR